MTTPKRSAEYERVMAARARRAEELSKKTTEVAAAKPKRSAEYERVMAARARKADSEALGRPSAAKQPAAAEPKPAAAKHEEKHKSASEAKAKAKKSAAKKQKAKGKQKSKVPVPTVSRQLSAEERQFLEEQQEARAIYNEWFNPFGGNEGYEGGD